MILLCDDLSQCTYSGDKTGHWRSGDPGTNLPDPRLFVGDTRIDDR